MNDECKRNLKKFLIFLIKLNNTLLEACGDELSDEARESVRRRIRAYIMISGNINSLTDDNISILISSLSLESLKSILNIIKECAKENDDMIIYWDVVETERILIEEGTYKDFLTRLNRACDPYAQKIEEYMRKMK